MASADKNQTEPASKSDDATNLSRSEFDAIPVRISYLEWVLRQEKIGARPYRRLTDAQLAEVLEHYHRRPVPDDMHDFLLARLRGERQSAKSGNAPETDPTTLLQRYLLPGVYQQGIGRAKRLRPWLKKRVQRSPRRKRNEDIPSVETLAVRHVKSRLPAFRHLAPGSIANLVSKMRSS
jgi:hypothetical protein